MEQLNALHKHSKNANIIRVVFAFHFVIIFFLLHCSEHFILNAFQTLQSFMKKTVLFFVFFVNLVNWKLS